MEHHESCGVDPWSFTNLDSVEEGYKRVARPFRRFPLTSIFFEAIFDGEKKSVATLCAAHAVRRQRQAPR